MDLGDNYLTITTYYPELSLQKFIDVGYNPPLPFFVDFTNPQELPIRMSYINKRTRAFNRGPVDEVVSIRSEGRMKNYPSARDIRAWSDIVEERRQHILEYMAKNKRAMCPDKLIPLDILLDAMMAQKNARIRKLEKRIEYLEKMLDLYSKLSLTPEQQKKLEALRKDIEEAYAELGSLKSEREELETVYDRRKSKSDEYSGAKPKKMDKKRPSHGGESEDADLTKRTQRKKKARVPAREVPETSGDEEITAPKKYKGKKKSLDERRERSEPEKITALGGDEDISRGNEPVKRKSRDVSIGKKKKTSDTDMEEKSAKEPTDVSAVSKKTKPDESKKVPSRKPISDTEYELHPERTQGKKGLPKRKEKTDIASKPRPEAAEKLKPGGKEQVTKDQARRVLSKQPLADRRSRDADSQPKQANIGKGAKKKSIEGTKTEEMVSKTDGERGGLKSISPARKPVRMKSLPAKRRASRETPLESDETVPESESEGGHEVSSVSDSKKLAQPKSTKGKPKADDLKDESKSRGRKGVAGDRKPSIKSRKGVEEKSLDRPVKEPQSSGVKGKPGKVNIGDKTSAPSRKTEKSEGEVPQSSSKKSDGLKEQAEKVPEKQQEVQKRTTVQERIENETAGSKSGKTLPQDEVKKKVGVRTESDSEDVDNIREANKKRRTASDRKQPDSDVKQPLKVSDAGERSDGKSEKKKPVGDSKPKEFQKVPGEMKDIQKQTRIPESDERAGQEIRIKQEKPTSGSGKVSDKPDLGTEVRNADPDQRRNEQKEAIEKERLEEMGKKAKQKTLEKDGIPAVDEGKIGEKKLRKLDIVKEKTMEEAKQKSKEGSGTAADSKKPEKAKHIEQMQPGSETKVPLQDTKLKKTDKTPDEMPSISSETNKVSMKEKPVKTVKSEKITERDETQTTEDKKLKPRIDEGISKKVGQEDKRSTGEESKLPEEKIVRKKTEQIGRDATGKPGIEKTQGVHEIPIVKEIVHEKTKHAEVIPEKQKLINKPEKKPKIDTESGIVPVDDRSKGKYEKLGAARDAEVTSEEQKSMKKLERHPEIKRVAQEQESPETIMKGEKSPKKTDKYGEKAMDGEVTSDDQKKQKSDKKPPGTMKDTKIVPEAEIQPTKPEKILAEITSKDHKTTDKAEKLPIISKKYPTKLTSEDEKMADKPKKPAGAIVDTKMAPEPQKLLKKTEKIMEAEIAHKSQDQLDEPREPHGASMEQKLPRKPGEIVKAETTSGESNEKPSETTKDAETVFEAQQPSRKHETQPVRVLGTEVKFEEQKASDESEKSIEKKDPPGTGKEAEIVPDEEKVPRKLEKLPEKVSKDEGEQKMSGLPQKISGEFVEAKNIPGAQKLQLHPEKTMEARLVSEDLEALDEPEELPGTDMEAKSLPVAQTSPIEPGKTMMSELTSDEHEVLDEFIPEAPKFPRESEEALEDTKRGDVQDTLDIEGSQKDQKFAVEMKKEESAEEFSDAVVGARETESIPEEIPRRQKDSVKISEKSREEVESKVPKEILKQKSILGEGTDEHGKGITLVPYEETDEELELAESELRKKESSETPITTEPLETTEEFETPPEEFDQFTEEKREVSVSKEPQLEEVASRGDKIHEAGKGEMETLEESGKVLDREKQEGSRAIDEEKLDESEDFVKIEEKEEKPSGIIEEIGVEEIGEGKMKETLEAEKEKVPRISGESAEEGSKIIVEEPESITSGEGGTVERGDTISPAATEEKATTKREEPVIHPGSELLVETKELFVIPEDEIDKTTFADQLELKQQEEEDRLRQRKEPSKDIQHFEHRCAALIRHAKERCAAMASRSGGILVFPDSMGKKQNLIPTGYWPGEVLSEHTVSESESRVPVWVEQREMSTSGGDHQAGTSAGYIMTKNHAKNVEAHENKEEKCPDRCPKKIYTPRDGSGTWHIGKSVITAGGTSESQDDSPDRIVRDVPVQQPSSAPSSTDQRSPAPRSAGKSRQDDSRVCRAICSKQFTEKPHPTQEVLASDQTESRVLVDYSSEDTEDDKFDGEALLGSRISRVLSGDATGLGSATFPATFTGSRTLSGEILQRRLSEKIPQKTPTEMSSQKEQTRPCSAMISKQQRDAEKENLVEDKQIEGKRICSAMFSLQSREVVLEKEQIQTRTKSTITESSEVHGIKDATEPSTSQGVEKEDIAERKPVIKLFERDIRLDQDVTSEEQIEGTISDEVRAMLEDVLDSLDDIVADKICVEELPIAEDIEQKTLEEETMKVDIDEGESQYEDIDQIDSVLPQEIITDDTVKLVEKDEFVSAIDTSTAEEEIETMLEQMSSMPSDGRIRKSKDDMDISSTIAKVLVDTEEEVSITELAGEEGPESAVDETIVADETIPEALAPDDAENIYMNEETIAVEKTPVEGAEEEIEICDDTIIAKNIIEEMIDKISETAVWKTDAVLRENIYSDGYETPMKDFEESLVLEGDGQIDVGIFELFHGEDSCYTPRILSLRGPLDIDGSLMDASIIQDNTPQYIDREYVPRAISVGTTDILEELLDRVCGVDGVMTPGEVNRMLDDRLLPVPVVLPSPTIPVGPERVKLAAPQRVPVAELPQAIPDPFRTVPRAVMFAPVPVEPTQVPEPVSTRFFPRLFGRKRDTTCVMKKDSDSQTVEPSTKTAEVCALSGLLCDCCKMRITPVQMASKSISVTIKSRPGKEVCRGPCAKLPGDEPTISGDNRGTFARNQDKLEKLMISVTPKDSEENSPTLIIHKDAEIIALKDALAAKESYCAEQRKIAAAALEQLENIKNIVEERDDLRKKLENSQDELEEIKRNIALGYPFGISDTRSVSPTSLGESQSVTCEEEIQALENEINDMRSGKLTPDLEAKVIRKEVEVLKKYCAKLSVIQKENHQLKNQITKYEDKLNKLGCLGDDAQIVDLKEKLNTLNDTVNERDELKCRCSELEKELLSFTDLPEDIEVFKQRSLLLDEVLQDRDRLSKRVEQLRGVDEELYSLRKKASRVDELEENLKRLSKDKKLQDEELDHLRCKCSFAEIEALNQKAEGDTLKSKIACLEHEVESMKCLCKDKDRLRQERDELQKNLDELLRMQNNFDHMKNQLKCMDMLKKERDVYKTKYENLMGLECECDILRAQVDRAKGIEKERNALENQVEDLETCIADQENEIRRLVCHIDILAKGRDEQQEKLKDVLCTMRAELEKKDDIIRSSEEKLSLVQKELITSIQGLSSETTNLKCKNDTLEKCLCNLQKDKKTLENEKETLEKSLLDLQKDHRESEEKKKQLETCLCNLELTAKSITEEKTLMKVQLANLKEDADKLDTQLKELTSDNEFLIEKLQEREAHIKYLQDVLKDHEPMLKKLEMLKQTARDDSDRYELEVAKLQQPTSLIGDEHLHELLRQSKHAVQGIALELCKQYEEWDCVKNKLKQIKKDDKSRMSNKECTCVCKCGQDSSRSEDNSTQDSRGDDKSVTAKTTDNSATQNDGVIKDDKGVSARALENAGTQYPRKQGTATEDYTKWDCYRKTDQKEKVKKESKDDEPPGVIAREDRKGIRTSDKNIGDICKCIDTGTDGDPEIGRTSRGQDATIPSISDEISPDQSPDIHYAPEITESDTKYEYDVSKWSCKTTEKPDTREYEFDVSKWSCRQPKPEENKIDEETEDEMHTARSNEDKCKHLEERIEFLEKELSDANETILKLQDQLSSSDRTAAENQALRRHSSEVQEVAKDQIEELVEHLKKARERVAILEEENAKLNDLLKNMHSEKDEFIKMIKDLQGGEVGDSDMKKELDECLEEKSALEARIAMLEKQLSDDVPEDEKLRDLLALNKNLEERLKNEMDLRQQVEGDNELLKKRVGELEKSVSKGDELEELRKKLKDAEDDLERETESRLKSEKKAEEFLKAGDSGAMGRLMQEELEELRKKLQEAEENIEKETNARQKAEDKNAELLKGGDISDRDESRLKELEDLKKKLKDAEENLKREMEEREKVENKFADLLKAGDSSDLERIKQKEIDDLRKKLQDAETKLKSTGDTSEIDKLRKELDDEKNKSKNLDELMSQIQKLKKEKDDLEKMLASNVLTTSRRSSKMRSDLDILDQKKQELQDENDRLKRIDNDNKDRLQKLTSCEDENKHLKDHIEKLESELEKLKKQTPDSGIIDALKKENENLLKKIEAQAREIADLLDRMKTPKPVVEISKSQIEKEMKEKQTLQSIIADLENQLKNLSREDKKVPLIGPSDDLQKVINDLTKRLEDEQKRADTAELALRHMKTSDPSAMLNAEIAKLKKQLSEIENENTKLKKQLLESTNEATKLKKDLDTASNEAKKISEENLQQKQLLSNLQKENSDLKSSTEKLRSGISGDDFLKGEVRRLTDQIAQLEKDKASLRNEVSSRDTEIKNAYDKISKLQNEISDLKQNLVKLQSENDKLKKDLDSAMNNAKNTAAKVAQLENDNDKLRKDIRSQEGEQTKMKHDLDSALNAAKKGTSGVSDLQDEISKLKQKINQLEAENANLKKDLDAALDNSKSTSAKLAQMTSDFEKLKNAKAVAEEKLAKLQNDLDSTRAEAKKAASDVGRQQNDISDLKDKLARLELENAKLKKDLNSALEDTKKSTGLMDEDAKLKQRLAQLENENSKLKKDLDYARGEAKKTPELDKSTDVDKIREKILKLEADNSKLNKDLNASLDKLSKATATITQLQDDQNKLKQKLSSLENDNAQLKRDVNKALDDSKRYASEISALRDNESKLKQRIAQLESDNAKLKKDLDATSAGDKSNVNMIQSLKDEINNLKKKIAQLEQDNAKLKKDLESALKDIKLPPPVDDSEKLRVKVAQLEDANSKLKKDLDSLMDDHKKCPKMVSQLQDEIERLKKKIVDLEKDGAKWRSQYEGAMGDAKISNDELNKLRESESKLKKLLADSQLDINKLNKDIIALTAELKTTSANLAQSKDDVAKAKQRIGLLEGDNIQLKKNLDGTLDEMKKIQKLLAQLQEENPKLKLRVAQLETDNTKLKKDLDAAIADSKKGSAGADQMKGEDTRMRDLLAQLEKENKKLKSDLNNALDQAKQSVADVTKMRDDDSKQKQQIAKLENENAKLKKDLEKALNDALTNSSGAQGLREENNKLKQRVNQLEGEIAKLKSDLNAALENAKKGASGLSQMQADDAKLKQRISQLEKDNAKLKSDLEVALNEARAGGDTGTKLRNENTKQKQMIGQLEDEIAKLRKNLENALSDSKKGNSGLSNLQEENAKLKQRIGQLEKDNALLKKNLDDTSANSKAASSANAILTDENGALKQRVKQLENDLDKMRKDLNGALDDKKKALADLTAAKENEAKLKQRAAELESNNIKLKQDLDSVSGDAKSGKGDLNKLKDDNATMKQRTAQLEGENSKLKKDLDEALKDSKNKTGDIQRLKEEIAQLKQKIAELESGNARMKKELDSITSDFRNATSELTKLKDNIAKLNKASAQKDGQLNDLNKKLDDTKNKDSRIAELTNENDKLKGRITDLQNQVTKLSDELAKLKRDLSQRDGKINEMKKNLDKARADNESKEAKMKDLENKRVQEGSIDDSLAKVREEIGLRDKQVNDMKNKLEKAMSDNNKKDGKIKELTDENEKLKARLKTLENQLGKLNDSLSVANDIARKAEQDLSKIKGDYDKLKAENDTLTKSRTDADKLKEYEAKIKQLQAELAKQKKECTDNLASMKDQFDREMKDLLKKNEASIAKLQKANEEFLKELNERHDKDIESLQDALKKAKGDLDAVIKERDRLKALLEDQRRKSIEIKDKVEQVESIVKKERRKGREESQRRKDLEDKLDGEIKKSKDLESLSSLLRQTVEEHMRKSQELVEEKEIVVKKVTKLEKEKQNLERSSLIMQKALEEEQRKSTELMKDVESLRQKILSTPLAAEYKGKRKSEPLDVDRSMEPVDMKKSMEPVITSTEPVATEESMGPVPMKRSVAPVAMKKSMDPDTVEKTAEPDLIKASVGSATTKKSIEPVITSTEPVATEESMGPVPTKKSTESLKMQTFKTFSTDTAMPDVVAISTPLSDKELKFFGKTSCPCEPNLDSVLEKLSKFGLEALGIEELQLLHTKICDVTANVLAKIGQTSGVLKPNENDKLALLRRIASLEGDLLKKQKHAQQKVIAMQYAVKLEKERLSDLRRSLEEEKRKNSELLSQIGSQSKVVSNIQEERDLIQRQKSYHEQKLEQYLVAVEEERGKSRNLEDELEKEKSNNLHMKSLLEAERNRSRQNKRKDTEALEAMRIKLEKTVNSEMMLRMKLQEKTCRRNPSPHTCTPVRDSQQSYARQSSSRTRAAFYTDLSPGDGKSRTCTKRTFSSHSGGHSGSSNGLDLEDK